MASTSQWLTKHILTRNGQSHKTFSFGLQPTSRITHPIHYAMINSNIYTHTHTHPFNGPFPGLPRWASTRKVKPIWILLKQETVSGSDIRRAIMGNMQVCTALQTDNHDSTLPHSFYRLDALTTAEPTASKHWRHTLDTYSWLIIIFDAEERHFRDCFGHTGCP